MATSKTEIAALEINVAGKTIRLSLEQARELRDIMVKLFPATVEHIHHHDYYPYRWWHTQCGHGTAAPLIQSGSYTTAVAGKLSSDMTPSISLKAN